MDEETQLALFPEIDELATARRVRLFFDRDLPRLLNRAGRSITDLTSPQLDAVGCGGHGSFKNGQEAMIIDHLEAIELYNTLVDAVIKSLSLMRDSEGFHFHKTLLVDCYIKRVRDIEEMAKLGMSDSPITVHKREACVEFAEIFDSVKTQMGIPASAVPAMTVFRQ
ncbi:hypothetical protein BTI91_04440 [Lactobacillus delbrueckii subsp. bulgaricus]|nr:hypothetical protein [Lactobacillus delbrueckii subsp. bulgaricus]